MTAPKHTPGPWIAEGLNIWGPPDPRSNHANGRSLVGGVVDDMNDWRARFGRDPDPVIANAEFEEERKANAALISAAPDLLVALRATQNAMGMHGPCESNSCRRCTQAYDLASAAIKKASGR